MSGVGVFIFHETFLMLVKYKEAVLQQSKCIGSTIILIYEKYLTC